MMLKVKKANENPNTFQFFTNACHPRKVRRVKRGMVELKVRRNRRWIRVKAETFSMAPLILQRIPDNYTYQ